MFVTAVDLLGWPIHWCCDCISLPPVYPASRGDEGLGFFPQCSKYELKYSMLVLIVKMAHPLLKKLIGCMLLAKLYWCKFRVFVKYV